MQQNLFYPKLNPMVKCPTCSGPMNIRYRNSDHKPFFGCASYPRCRGTRPSEGIKACPECGSSMTLRKQKTKFVSFWGCTSFPSCRATVPFTEFGAKSSRGAIRNPRSNQLHDFNDPSSVNYGQRPAELDYPIEEDSPFEPCNYCGIVPNQFGSCEC